MGKKKAAAAEPREPQPPTGYQPPATTGNAAAPATKNALAPDDDKLFVKAVKKSGEKIKEKRRQLEQAKIALRNAKAELQEAECSLEQLANEELPLFKQGKGARKRTTVTQTMNSEPVAQKSLPLETPSLPAAPTDAGPATEPAAPRRRGRPRKDASSAPATAS